MSLNLSPPIDKIPSLPDPDIMLSVLRLDLVHPVISGNKAFKLLPHFTEARNRGIDIMASFGGAWSNHILALAAFGKEQGVRTIGLIRGETTTQMLEDAAAMGMELIYISRENYKNKIIPDRVTAETTGNEMMIIPEGGYGDPGVKGASAITASPEFDAYTHIISGVGTGTTLAGLILNKKEHQTILGVPVLKNSPTIKDEINRLLPDHLKDQYRIIPGFEFGGYAKKNDELIQFINRWYQHSQIPTDFVYTGKVFYAVNEMIRQGLFSKDDSILVLHTGGLQGNRSLPNGSLIF